MICFVFTYVISAFRSRGISLLHPCPCHWIKYIFAITTTITTTITSYYHTLSGYWCVGRVVPPWVHQTMVVGPEASSGQVWPLKMSVKLGDWPLNLANTLSGTNMSPWTLFTSCPHTPSYLCPCFQYPCHWHPCSHHCLWWGHSLSQWTSSPPPSSLFWL